MLSKKWSVTDPYSPPTSGDRGVNSIATHNVVKK